MKAIRALTIGFALVCQIYGILVGLSILWRGIQILLGHQTTVYVAGSPYALPLTHFNPGLGYFCFGWGLTYSVFKNASQRKGGFTAFCAALFGLANIVVGAADLLGWGIGFYWSAPGFPGFCYAMLLGGWVFGITMGAIPLTVSSITEREKPTYKPMYDDGGIAMHDDGGDDGGIGRFD